MPDEQPGRRPTGSGVDGTYRQTRKPTVDATDDIYDEDGVLMEELEEDSDLTLDVRATPDGTPPRPNLDRTDKGAVNIEPDDLQR